MHAEIYNNEQTADKEFLFHYRVTRESFHDLVSHIKNHKEFQSPSNSKKVQAQPEYQLLVLLKYLGTQGNAATNTSLGDLPNIKASLCTKVLLTYEVRPSKIVPLIRRVVARS
jgi:hypothetical protein